MVKAIIVVMLLYIQPVLVFAADALRGGYNAVDLKDKQLQEVVNFAVQQMQQGTLVKIVSAKRQIVAGLNYSVQLEMLGANGVHNLYNVIIYVPLPQTNQSMQLTNVQFIGEVPEANIEQPSQSNVTEN